MLRTSTTRAETTDDTTHETTPETTHDKASRFIAELAARDPQMPLGAIQVLLYLYENREAPHGVTLRKLRVDLGLNATIASRSLYYWKEDMISVQIDPTDRRGRT